MVSVYFSTFPYYTIGSTNQKHEPFPGSLSTPIVLSLIHIFYGFFTRRNTLAILISIELILNATDINFAVFNRFLFPGGLEGSFFSLFSIAISAAETAVALSLIHI